MTHWKPYRVFFRQGYHYFEKIDGARRFIKDFEKNKIEKPFIIEKINKEKFNAGPQHYKYNEIYDDYEVWVLTPDGWKTKRLQK